MEHAELVPPYWRESRRTVGGVALHVVEAGREGDPLLVLPHGFPEFWWAWRQQIGPFVEAGHHVVVPDLRGYNTSDAPQDVGAYHLDTLAANVVQLARNYGADRFRLVGHDRGAVISWPRGTPSGSRRWSSWMARLPMSGALRHSDIRRRRCAAPTSPSSSCPGCPRPRWAHSTSPACGR